MKKIIILILILVIVYIGYLNIFKETISDETNIATDEGNMQDIIIDNSEDVYVDTNPMSVGFYLLKNNKMELVEEYTAPWTVGPPDICVLSVLPSSEDIVNESTFKTAFEKCISEYEDVEEYRIGYHIKFNMIDGTFIDKNILTVGDAEDKESFQYIMVFLYDDVNLKPGQRKYHVEEETFTEETIFSSIKLTGGVNANDVESPIELSVFMYKDENDFDVETGNYRGNCIYTINIHKKV